jgi:hypothetical protein
VDPVKGVSLLLTGLAVFWFLVVVAVTYEPPKHPAAVTTPGVPYCQGYRPAASKQLDGTWEKGWSFGWMPCSEVDRYENT